MRMFFTCFIILVFSAPAMAASPPPTSVQTPEMAWPYTNGMKDRSVINGAASLSPLTNHGFYLVNALGQSAAGSLGSKLRMQVMAENNGTISGEADLLIPLYDTVYSSVFSQIGIRSLWDDRWNANIGIGQRWYPQARKEQDGSLDSGSWMLGYNAFFDYDLTRSHQRGGIGVEAQYDMLKLSSNYYFPLSGWRDAKGDDESLEYYMERPAEGWDVRLRGELPFYREIALTAAYTQWYGDEVGVFGSSQREKNPKVWSYGLEYSPVPLVTVYAEQSRTEQGRSENTIGFRLTYTFGAPFEDAVKPVKREGQQPRLDRRDFVDRENRIVLAYKQKPDFVVTLSRYRFEVPSQGNLHIGLVTTSGVLANAVAWEGSAAPFITNSGSAGADFTLPVYDSTPGANNTYLIRAIARNESGQSASSPVATITVLPPATAPTIEPKYALELTALNARAVEDDCLITATLTDNGTPVSSARITWSIVSGTGTLSITSAKTGGKGKSRTTFTAMRSGPVTVRARYEPASGVAVIRDIQLVVVAH